MKLFIPAERRAEAVEILTTLQGRLEISSEYLGSWIQERDYPCSHIVYIEHWKSAEAIYSHIRSSLYRRILTVIDFSSREPEVNFYFGSEPKGMELVKALRDEVQKQQ